MMDGAWAVVGHCRLSRAMLSVDYCAVIHTGNSLAQ